MFNFFNELFHNLSNKNESKNSNFIDELGKSIKKEPLYTLDRFEGNIAVLGNRVNGEMINVESSFISKDAKPGSILKLENDIYIVDELETKKTQEKVKNLLDKLYKRN